MGWVAVGVFVAAGVGVLVARDDVAALQQAFFGGRMPQGCVLVAGVLGLLGTLGCYLAYRAGLLRG